MSDAFLEVRDLTMRFGGLTAIDRLSFSVKKGTIHGLIGPNGAGKTTTFNVISGFYQPTDGGVFLNDKSMTGLKMYETARRGLIRTFQHSTLFAELSVLENVLVGTHMAHPPSILDALTGKDRQVRREARQKAEAALAFFDLLSLSQELAGDLPHGHQRALGMAVALASQPEVMLLDEPFTGMNPEETHRMMELMVKLKTSGVTILLVEHDMQAIMGLCDKITCMSFGKLLAEGGPSEIRHHPAVIEAYLGGARHVA